MKNVTECMHDDTLFSDGGRLCRRCMRYVGPGAVKKAYPPPADPLPAPWDLKGRKLPSDAELALLGAGMTVLWLGVVVAAVVGTIRLILGEG